MDATSWWTTWGATWVQTLGALIAALIAVAWTVHVQRKEGFKQRQITAASDVIINSFHVVRYCHRNADLMRDYDSKFDTSLRAWSIDLLHQDGRRILPQLRKEGRAFVQEALQWRVRLQKDALRIAADMEDGRGDLHLIHRGPELDELRNHARTFANFVTAWSAEPWWWRRRRLVVAMTKARTGWWGNDDLGTFLNHDWPTGGKPGA
ncbi:hypothetical protein [Pedococcus aerophilus]|uniref:hypothetical protein n=1 Tax=Pedococcus aerophilus TaxID=436356 RepID=UPI0031E34569